MKRNFGRYLVTLTGALAFVCVVSACANAQDKGNQKSASPGYAKNPSHPGGLQCEREELEGHP